MMKHRIHDYALKLPNNLTVGVIGYADDSSVIVGSDEGIQEIFKILKEYEMATNAILNYKKTNIIGLGRWRGRMNQPISGINVLTGSCKILGIYGDYEYAKMKNWEKVEDAISKSVGQLYDKK